MLHRWSCRRRTAPCWLGLLAWILAAPLAAQVRFEVRSETGGAGEPLQVGVNQVFRALATIVNAGGAAVQGFQMALTHDAAFLDFQSATWSGTALDVPALNDASGPGPFFFQAKELGAPTPGVTLGVVFEDQAVNFVLPAGEWKAAAFSYRALKLTAEGAPTRIDYSPADLGTPPVGNKYSDRDSGETRVPQLSGAAVTIGAESSYTIAFRDATASVDSGAELTIPVQIANNPRAVHGFSFGVRHEAASLDLLDVTLAPGVLTVVGTADDRFLAIDKAPQGGGAGFTVAMVLSSDASAEVLDPARSPHHVIDARYRARGAGVTTPVQVTGDLGVPKVEVLLDLAGVAQRPVPPSTNPPPTTISVEIRGGTGETRFIRGDVDQNRRINITDAIGIFGYLFSGDTLPAVFKPTVDNCLIAFNVDGSTGATGEEEQDRVDVSDAIYHLSYQFLSGPDPPAPFGDGRSCGAFTGRASERMRCRQFACQ